MAMPDFQSCMLPILKILSNGQELSRLELSDRVSDYFNLSEEERNMLLPSGNETYIRNRVDWARIYLIKAGFIKKTRKGHYAITEKGLELLKTNPQTVNIKTLMNYEEFVKWRKRESKIEEINKTSDENQINAEPTPEEAIEVNAKRINDLLADDLLNKVKEMKPYLFERMVLELLLKMGYGGAIKEAGSVTGGPGDEGIDGIIKEDKLGLDVIYLQAKKWDGPVGRPEIQKFAGTLLGKKATKGVFITTSSFTKEAEEYAKSLDKKNSPDRREKISRAYDRI